MELVAKFNKIPPETEPQIGKELIEDAVTSISQLETESACSMREDWHAGSFDSCCGIL
jgi:hypothetical protein